MPARSASGDTSPRRGVVPEAAGRSLWKAAVWTGVGAAVVCAVLALYLNVFVLIVQLFMKVPALKEMAPTQSEPPFAITQLVVLLLFVLLGAASAIRFRVIQTSIS